MNRLAIEYVKKLLKKYNTFEAFEEKRQNIKTNSNVFEIIAHHGMKVSMIFGSKGNEVYWPNRISSELIEKYTLHKILAGGRTKGADTFLNKLMDNGKKKLIAVEFKSKFKDKKDTLKAGKIAYKEVALNRHTKIGKKDRIVIHDFDDESKNLLEDLDNWTYIHISEFYNEETFDDIRNNILNGTLPIYSPWGFRPDLLNENYDKKICDLTWKRMLKQKKTYGNSKGLFIGPTAIGKGTKQPVLFRKYWYPHWLKTKKKNQRCVVISINPGLVVLSGNVVKQLKDHLGSGLPVKTMVCASDVDLAPDENIKDLDAFELYTSVAHNRSEFENIYDDLKKDDVLWINTTLHSYFRVIKYLKIVGIEKANLMFIDEVKNTVCDEISVFTDCLFDKRFPVTDRLGLDANIKDDKDEKGKMVTSSMRNKKIWREIYVKMKGKKAWELGWRRRDVLVIQPWEDTGLPLKLKEAIAEGKNGMIKYKGWRKPVPFHWIVSIMANIEARYRIPDITACLNRVSFRRNSNAHATFANYITSALVNQLPKIKSKSQVLLRLQKLKWLSIYKLKGAKSLSSTSIQRQVARIPYDYPDVNVNQDRMLTEGWDPGAHPKYPGWLNSWQMTDPSSSKIRICQLGGRPARPGDDIWNMVKKINYCILPVIVQKNLDKLVQLQKISENVRKVAQSLEIGKDVIEESCIILPWGNVPTPPVKRKRGGAKGILVTLDAKTIMSSVVRTYKGYKFSPYTKIADELCDHLRMYYSEDVWINSLKVRELNRKIFKIKKYQSFYKLFSGGLQKDLKRKMRKGIYVRVGSQHHFARVRDVLLTIRKGTFWMLSEEKQIEAGKQFRKFKKEIEPNYYLKKYTNIINETKKVFAKGIGEGDLMKKVHANLKGENDPNMALFGAITEFSGVINKKGKKEKGIRIKDKGWESLPGGRGHGSLSWDGRNFYKQKKFRQKKGMPATYLPSLYKLHKEFRALINGYCQRMNILKDKIRDDYNQISKKSVLCSNPALSLRYEIIASKYKLYPSTIAHIILGKDQGRLINPKIRKADKKHSQKNKKILKSIVIQSFKELIKKGKKGEGMDKALIKSIEKEMKKKGLISPSGLLGSTNRLGELLHATKTISDSKKGSLNYWTKYMVKLEIRPVKKKDKNGKIMGVFAPTHGKYWDGAKFVKADQKELLKRIEHQAKKSYNNKKGMKKVAKKRPKTKKVS